MVMKARVKPTALCLHVRPDLAEAPTSVDKECVIPSTETVLGLSTLSSTIRRDPLRRATIAKYHRYGVSFTVAFRSIEQWPR